MFALIRRAIWRWRHRNDAPSAISEIIEATLRNRGPMYQANIERNNALLNHLKQNGLK